MIETKLDKQAFSVVAKIRFVLFSVFGIAAFFLSFEFNGNRTFLVNHLATYIRVTLGHLIPYVVLLMGSIAVMEIIQRKPKCFKDPVNTVLSIFKVIGFIGIILAVLKVGPSFLMDPSVIPFVLDRILISISISIPVAAIFLPFLLDYGLVDSVGVLMRPIMRPAFKCPGRSAVIAVTAFLGNFSVGHIAIDSLYKEGKLTEKEAAIMGTGFCTASVAFLLVIAGILEIMDHWVFYFWSALAITFITTFISVRIWPLNKKRDDFYYATTVPQPEPIFKTDLIKNAITVGLYVAEKAEPLQNRVWFLLRESIFVLASIVCGAMFFGTVGILINQNTAFFTYIGYVFWPFLKLVNAPDALVIANAAGISFLEITLPAVIGIQEGVSDSAKYIIATIPVSSIIFLAGFIPCILSTEIPVKFTELFVLWVQRTILTVMLAGILALLYF